jgi:hypothetical protein
LLWWLKGKDRQRRRHRSELRRGTTV